MSLSSCAHIGRAKNILAFVLSLAFIASQPFFMLYKLSRGQMTENGAIITFARNGTRTPPFFQYKKTEPQS